MNMRNLIFSLIMTAATVSFANAATMQCETYRVENGKKTERTIFTFSFESKKSHVSYRKKSGPDWIIPNEAELEVIWKSENDLRMVVKWMDNKYEKDEKAWHPLFVFDIDFSKPCFKVDSFGGFSDFDIIVSDPWKFEYKRLD